VYHFTPLILFLFFVTPTKGQEQLPLEYQLQIAQQGLDWFSPEVPYKVLRNPSMVFQEYDFAVNLRKEKLEIRYLFVPVEPDSDQALIPHLSASRMAMHLASNAEDSYLVAHEVDSAVMDTVYHADWVQIYFFKPKQVFSASENCQMLAFYREGLGLCYAFLLFDDPPVTLPERMNLMRFRPRNLPK
jgi:hypothetical protein